MKSLKTFFAAFAFLSAALLSAQVPFKSGESIAFLGGTVVDQGIKNPSGCINLIMDALKRGGLNVTLIPAAVSGNHAADMAARIDDDVIAKKPQWMFLCCGISDPADGESAGIPIEKFQESVNSILDKCKAANIQVIILTATPVKEDPDHAANKNQVPYNEFLRKAAADRQLLIVDLNKRFNAIIARKSDKKKDLLMQNGGPSMTPIGDINIAITVLSTLGMTSEQLSPYAVEWQRRPDAWTVPVKLNLSIREMDQLKHSLAPGQTLEQRINDIVHKSLKK